MANSFQNECVEWAMSTFDMDHVRNTYVRACRFGEEALELLQALDVTKEDALKLVDYVYGRPKGEPPQEVGGVMVTLAVLCNSADLNMDRDGAIELHRCWKNIEKIRAKQAQKPSFLKDPLPGADVVAGPGMPKTEEEALGLCNCDGQPEHIRGVPEWCDYFVQAEGYSEKV